MAGGIAPLDTDRDGMPDSWESARGLNPGNAADGALLFGGTGYTNVEIYLNSLSGSGHTRALLCMLLLLTPVVDRTLRRTKQGRKVLAGRASST